MTRPYTIALFIGILVFLSGCNPAPPPAANSNGNPNPKPPNQPAPQVVESNQPAPAVPVTPPRVVAPVEQPQPAVAVIEPKAAPVFRGEIVTEGEYVEAARAIEKGMAEGTAFMKFDPGAVVRTALGGFGIKESTINQAGSDYIASGARTFQQFTLSIRNGAAYQLLRVVKDEEKYRAIYRLSGPEGLNYHVMDLAQNERGEIVGCDLYLALAGGPLSITMRKMALPIYSRYPEVAKELARPDGEYAVDFERLRPITSAIDQQDFGKVLALCDELPNEIKKTKMVMVLRLKCAVALGDAEKFTTAAEDFRRQRPDEITPDLMGISVYVATNQPDAAHAAIDRIDQFVGGDPYLDLPRAQVALGKGEPENAERLLLKAAASPITPLEVLDELIDLSQSRKEFDKTFKHLLELERRMNVRIPDLQQFPEYAEFVKSPQYQEWLKREKK